MCDERPMVSINCLVYNHQPYLRECLEGFVCQETNFDFEVLIHDDASTDGSVAIIKEYVERYPHIFKPIYQKVNQYSRRVAFLRKIQRERARGKYFTFCEGDDYWIDKHKLQRQVDFLEAHPDYNLCFHDCKVWDEENQCMMSSWQSLGNSREVLLSEFFSKKVDAYTLSMMFRTEHYQESGHIASCAPVGDYPAVLLAMYYGKAYYMQEQMGVYRLNRPGSWSLRKRTYGFYKDYCWRYIRFFIAFNRFTGYKYRWRVYRKQLKYLRYFVKKSFGIGCKNCWEALMKRLSQI